VIRNWPTVPADRCHACDEIDCAADVIAFTVEDSATIWADICRCKLWFCADEAVHDQAKRDGVGGRVPWLAIAAARGSSPTPRLRANWLSLPRCRGWIRTAYPGFGVSGPGIGAPTSAGPRIHRLQLPTCPDSTVPIRRACGVRSLRVSRAHCASKA
jgi:hypothetical protein